MPGGPPLRPEPPAHRSLLIALLAPLLRGDRPEELGLSGLHRPPSQRFREGGPRWRLPAPRQADAHAAVAGRTAVTKEGTASPPGGQPASERQELPGDQQTV